MMITPQPAKPKHTRKKDKRPSSRGSSEKSSTVSSEEQDTTESDKSVKSSSEISSRESGAEQQLTNESTPGVNEVKKQPLEAEVKAVEIKDNKSVSVPAKKAGGQ